MILEITLEKHAFHPGEILRGKLLWNSQVDTLRATLRLGWYVGRGDALDVMSHCEEDFILRGSTGTLSFELILPQAPLSFEGELFSLRWSLEASVEGQDEPIRISLSIRR